MLFSRYLHRLPRQGSAVPYDNSTSKTMSLPYPDSDHPLDVNSRNTLPASFQPGRMGFDASGRPSDISDDMQHQGLPLRFGKGERPDSDNEPDSEDEYIPTRHTFDEPPTRQTQSEYTATMPPPVVASISPPVSQSVDPPALVPTHVPQPFVFPEDEPGPQPQQHEPEPHVQPQVQPRSQYQPTAPETVATEIISPRNVPIQYHEPALSRRSLTQNTQISNATSQLVYPTLPEPEAPSEQISHRSVTTGQRQSIGSTHDSRSEVPTSPHKPYEQLTAEDVNQGEIPFGNSDAFSFDSQIGPQQAQPTAQQVHEQPKEDDTSESAPNISRNMSPPRGIAARMMHSPHSRPGGRLGPDGHSLRGAISLAAAQAQAQESELYQQEKQKADEEFSRDEAKAEATKPEIKALLPVEEVGESTKDENAQEVDPPKRKEDGMRLV